MANKFRLVGPLVAILLAGGLASYHHHLSVSSPVEVASPAVVRDPDRRELWAQIRPVLAEAEQRNAQASGRLVERIHAVFQRYQSGVEPLAADLTSLGTRLRILKRMPGGWWSGDQRVAEFVQGKFDEHLFTQEQLQKDLEGAIAGFREDLQAAQNEMVGKIRATMGTWEIRGLEGVAWDRFAAQVHSRLVAETAQRGKDSVYSGLTALVASEASAMLAQQLVVRAAASLGTAAAAQATAAAGATGAGAGAGGGAGSLGGPVGAALGLGAGFVVGLGVDWWMSSRFESQLAAELREYLGQLEMQIVDGDTASPGIRPAVLRMSADLSRAQSRAVENLVGKVAAESLPALGANP